MGHRWPHSPPAPEPLPQSDIAEHEQNDDRGSDKPDDVVHDALPRFDTLFNSRATLLSRPAGERCRGIWRAVTTTTATARRSPAVRGWLPRGNDPGIVGARRVQHYVLTCAPIRLYGSGQRPSLDASKPCSCSVGWASQPGGHRACRYIKRRCRTKEGAAGTLPEMGIGR